jgi:hypothetical protein
MKSDSQTTALHLTFVRSAGAACCDAWCPSPSASIIFVHHFAKTDKRKPHTHVFTSHVVVIVHIVLLSKDKLACACTTTQRQHLPGGELGQRAPCFSVCTHGTWQKRGRHMAEMHPLEVTTFKWGQICLTGRVTWCVTHITCGPHDVGVHMVSLLLSGRFAPPQCAFLQMVQHCVSPAATC